jgi:hypothetical protein
MVMMRNFFCARVFATVAVAAFVAVFAFGCATTEQVKKAQATADEALRMARAAESKADSARMPLVGQRQQPTGQRQRPIGQRQLRGRLRRLLKSA